MSQVPRSLSSQYLSFPFQSSPACLLGLIQDVELLRKRTQGDVAIPLTDHKPHYSSIVIVIFVLLHNLCMWASI